MRSLSSFVRSIGLCVLPSLILAGCGGSPNSTTTTQQQQPPPTNYQLSVTAPAAGTGTIASTPAGINCPGTCSASFASGTKVSLSETPAATYTFTGWGGSCSGTGACSVTMAANASVTAAFSAAGPVALTVALTGSGTGMVTSTPAGINCPGTCSANFASGTTVSLAASPTGFGGWGGGCSGTGACSVTMTASENVSASFTTTLPLFAVSVALTGAGSGTVTSSPAGINCSTASTAVCTYNFIQNTAVTLSATPITNDTFAGWSGSCTGTAPCSVTVTGASSVSAAFGGSLQNNINHIILFAQENRSLDHYFGSMRQYWANNGFPDQQFDGLPQFNPTSGISPLYGPPPSVPGCDPTQPPPAGCTVDPTNQISSFHFASVCQENQSPFWNEAHNDWDYQNPADQPAEANPPLNGFAFTAAYDARSLGYMDVNGVRAMGYFNGTDLNYYYYMASNFGTSDRWFSPVMDRTQVNRMYLLAATSQGDAYPIGGGVNDNHVLTATTIFEALQNAGISWKIYVDPQNVFDSNGKQCTNEVSDANALCLIPVSYINMFAYEKTIIDSQGQTPDLLLNIVPISQFKIDVANGTLPSFAYIEPASQAGLDEHAADSDGYPVNVQEGALYAENNVINPLMTSPSWKDSVLVLTYDEAGGYYDHVPPQPATAPGNTASDPSTPTDLNPAIYDICTKPGEVMGEGTCSFGWTGYRVPVTVISPYSVKNFVSHTIRDNTAVLAMVESRFGIAPLTARDQSQADLNEFFDFVNEPWATPPTPPTQTIFGQKAGSPPPCDLTPPASWNEPPPPPPTLSVTVSGNGSVSSSPVGINACTANSGTCTAPFTSGTSVTLTATPDTGNTFSGWTGANCTGTSTCTVDMTASTSVTATFTTGPVGTAAGVRKTRE
jgi:phospholipase C